MKDAGNNFFEVGHIARSHGLKGEVKIDFILDDPSLIQSLNLVYLKNVRGDFEPTRIADIREESRGQHITFFVKFEHIVDRSSADALKNASLYIEQSQAGDWKNYEKEGSLDGYQVFDESGNPIGVVSDVLETAAHPILVIDQDTDSLMVPFVDEFIVSVDDENECITCQNLDQFEED